VKQVLPVLQVKMARLDLQGLQVQLALRVQQVLQDLPVQQVRKVQQDATGKMQLSTQLSQISERYLDTSVHVIKI
jgi:hypothetical protein